MRTTRSTLNYLTGVGLAVATMAVSVLTKRWLVAWLGLERLGAYRVGFELQGILGILDLGLTGALVAMFARAVNQDGGRDLRSVFAVGLRAYLVVASLMILAGLVMIVFLPSLVSDLDPSLHNDLRLGFLIALLGIALPVMPFRAIAEASQRGFIVNAALVLQNVLVIGLSLLFAYLARDGRWGITGQYLALFLAMLVTTALLVRSIHKLYPGLISSALRFERSGRKGAWRELFKLNLATMALRISGQLSTNIDGLVVNWIVGLRSVIPFVYTQQLALLMQQQLQAVGNATWASLAELYFTEQHELFRRRLVELTKLVTVLGIAGFVPILFFNERFVHIWIPPDRVNGDVYSGFGVSLLAVLIGLSMAVLSLWGWVFQGTHQVARIVPVALTTTAVNVVVSILGTYRFGVIGPLIGTLTARLTVSCWWYMVLLRRHYHIPLRSWLGSIVRPVAIGGPYAVGVALLADRYRPEGFVTLGVAMAASSLVYLGAAWGLAFDGAERHLWRERGVTMLRGVRRRLGRPQAQPVGDDPSAR